MECHALLTNQIGSDIVNRLFFLRYLLVGCYVWGRQAAHSQTYYRPPSPSHSSHRINTNAKRFYSNLFKLGKLRVRWPIIHTQQPSTLALKYWNQLLPEQLTDFWANKHSTQWGIHISQVAVLNSTFLLHRCINNVKDILFLCRGYCFKKGSH